MILKEAKHGYYKRNENQEKNKDNREVERGGRNWQIINFSRLDIQYSLLNDTDS